MYQYVHLCQTTTCKFVGAGLFGGGGKKGYIPDYISRNIGVCLSLMFSFLKFPDAQFGRNTAHTDLISGRREAKTTV